jgi:hypothetical protein
MHRVVLSVAVLVTACGLPPMAPPVPVDAAPVHASFDRTWHAVIEAFSERNIPVKTIERSSGFIATDRMTVTDGQKEWADCSRVIYKTYVPEFATYNVLVRGDSSQASVKVTVAWETIDESDGSAMRCNTKGAWEQGFQARIKTVAEGRP